MPKRVANTRCHQHWVPQTFSRAREPWRKWLCTSRASHTSKYSWTKRGLLVSLKNASGKPSSPLRYRFFLSGSPDSVVPQVLTKCFRFLSSHASKGDRHGGSRAYIDLSAAHSPLVGHKPDLIGDSAFSSVKTAVQLRKRGLHFFGVVKTAYSHFPLKFLNKVELNEPGDCATATATVEGDPLITHVWLDKKRKGEWATDKSMYVTLSMCTTTFAKVLLPWKKSGALSAGGTRCLPLSWALWKQMLFLHWSSGSLKLSIRPTAHSCRS